MATTQPPISMSSSTTSQSIYEADSRRIGWTQLIESMDILGAMATKNGLTEEKLNELLADES